IPQDRNPYSGICALRIRNASPRCVRQHDDTQISQAHAIAGPEATRYCRRMTVQDGPEPSPLKLAYVVDSLVTGGAERLLPDSTDPRRRTR
ncbi:hypothetical protein, partial [Ruegeria atlantica]|uniref:hypothetical protein n=1 Tax=Ruegeria atlantica TaxID=81569 RepID=UPI001C9437D4